MSWDLLSTYGPTVDDSDIEALQSTVDGQRRGYDFVSLTEWAAANTTVPAVEVGSVLEINGAVFEINTSDIVIGTVPGGATDNLYIKLTVSGGTTVTADWSTTPPTWDTAKGGWFDGTGKVLPFIVDYDGATTWDNKREIVSRFNRNFILNANGGFSSIPGERQLATKTIDIGDWDMVSTSNVNIAHGLTFAKIHYASVLIRNDDDTLKYPINYATVAGGAIGQLNIQASIIQLIRESGGLFDNANYNSTSYNRGWITIIYEV